MRSVLLVMLLGAALFFSGAYYAGLLENMFPAENLDTPANVKVPIIDPATLGKDLYQPGAFPVVRVGVTGVRDPIVLRGIMNPMNVEEVPSPINGRILFIGEEVEEALVHVAGSAAFVAEPYYIATIKAGRQDFTKYYRRIYEGDTVLQDQMLAMMEPAKALGGVLEKTAKIAAADAERDAASAAEREGLIRYDRAKELFRIKAIANEELGTAQLTYIKLKNEHVAKAEAVKLARIEKDNADIDLRQHEIRAFMTNQRMVVKTIVRQTGYAVKQSEPILVVQNLERMLAEALIEEQYFSRIKNELERKNQARGKGEAGRILATVEPTLIESPSHELPGHRRDVTSVAVAKDMRIVSGSEDGTVCVWKQGVQAPLRKFDHDYAAVLAVACTPVGAARNLCVSGCADGGVYLWDLDGDGKEPVFHKPHAHGKDAQIASVAFSPDGKLFATGGSDGSIKIWTTDDTTELYAFDPAHGVERRHEDAVTSLHFTPQCRLISAGRDKTLRVWELKEKGALPVGKVIRDREGNIPHLGVSADGKWMLFDTITGHNLQLLSIEDQTMKHTLSTAANATPFDTFAVFSPDGSMILTAGAPEGRLQLWRTPDETSRGYEVRQFATKARRSATCAAFSPDAGKGGPTSFAVSASGPMLYVWSIPTQQEVTEHRIERVPLTLASSNIESNTGQIRIGFEVANPATPLYPTGRFEAGRPVTIVID